MARANVLFLIHGIGVHGGNWVEVPTEELKAAARGYVAFSNHEEPLAGEIDLIGIRYDDIFDTFLERTEELAAQFDPVVSSVIPNPLKKITGFLRDLDNPAAKYLGDVLLYRGFRLVTNTVLLHVMKIITRTMSDIGLEHEGTPIKYGVLGHSMGTAVAHDALHLLATTPWIQPSGTLKKLEAVMPDFAEKYRSRIGDDNPFSPENVRFDSVFMIANTSRLLHTTDVDPYRSVVRPVSFTDPVRAVCDKFYNIDHKLDPVGKIKRFRVMDAWRSDIENAMEFDVDHLYQANVHALEHYLKHPYVHGAIFGQLARSFGMDDWRDAWNSVSDGRFARFGGTYALQSKRSELERQLTGLLPRYTSQETIDRWIRIYRALNELENKL